MAELRLEVGLFRHTEQIYPGKLLVIRDGSWMHHAVEDHEFDPHRERLMGIAIWKPLPEFAPGLVMVESDRGEAFVAIVAGESNRPQVGDPIIDAWITRADALRKLQRGNPVSYGPVPLTPLQLSAATYEVSQRVRESALGLLNYLRGAERESLLAIARIADVERPSDDDLTGGINELLLLAERELPLGSSDGEEASAAIPDGDQDDAQPVALGQTGRLVFSTLAGVDPAVLCSIRDIRKRMPLKDQLGPETVRSAVLKLIEGELAERPNGPRGGVRLTTKGRTRRKQIES